MLERIKSPEDLKKLSQDELPVLAQEIRKNIITTVGKNGGHLASNLGVVELTIALHRVFDSPKDAIVWDVSHQSYAHKLLTGRYDNFGTLRTKGGISGFTRISESPHDFFDAGHASSSISSALGLLTAWKLEGRNDKVVAVIGDGALTGGMAYEALSHAGLLSQNLIVIVNDNQMSINRNVGSLSRYLSRLSMTTQYQSLRHSIDRAIDLIPYVNRHVGRFVYQFKRGLKGLFLTNNLFVDLGFEFVGPLDGHNLYQLETTLRKVSKIPRPVVIHIMTKKGKGYTPAEENPSVYHGVSPFSLTEGVVDTPGAITFTDAFRSKIVELGKQNDRVCAITAAMTNGTGLDAFAATFKKRFFDVGIAEEHAVTFGGGLAAGGLTPVVAIYSTFIQRSIDQIIMDVALQNRHVVMCFDRAGAVPSDGETHQGIFDISLLRPVPNLSILSVASKSDLEVCLEWAVNVCKGPVCIRWAKAACPKEVSVFENSVREGRGLLVESSSFAPSTKHRRGTGASARKVLLVCTGGMYGETLEAARNLLLSGIECSIYSLRFIKPFDDEYFLQVCAGYDSCLFIEDGVKMGGISEYAVNVLSHDLRTKKVRTAVLAFPDKFLCNGNRLQVLEMAGLDSDSIYEKAKELMGK